MFDRAVALRRVDNDESLLFDLAKMFCAEMPKRLSAVRDSLNEKDADGLRRSSHSLKGSISAFAARRATEAAARLEELAQSNDLSEAEAAYEALAIQVDLLRDGLEAFIKEDKRVSEGVSVHGQN